MATSDSSAQRCDPFADRRVYPRVPVALPAFVQSDGSRHSAQIVDLSAGGAKLSCPVELPVGATIMVDCGGLGRSATVRWENCGLVGISFQTELNARELNALVNRSEALASRMNIRD